MSRNRKGFWILEMIGTLAILASLAVLGTELMRTNLRITHQAVAAHELSIRLTSAVAALRSDIWKAKTFLVTNGQSLHLESPLGPPVDWSIEDGDLVRSEGDHQRRWSGAGTDSAFNVDGPAIVLIARSHGGSHGDVDPLRLISQLQLANQENR